jgi:flagellar basal-body rod protein FlgB
MADSLNELFKVQEEALKLREGRQVLLASNIANADTPNYKARDINFAEKLQQILQDKQNHHGPLALATTSPAHQTNHVVGQINAMAQYRNDQQGAIDGNNVNVDQERMALAKNAFDYEASLTFINGRIRSMLTVIQS